jgi:dipicolinate synthase subunit A
MKDDRSLAISNATSVGEAVLCLLVNHTERVLPEYRILVLGYGATGAALVDDLLGVGCHVSVAARRRDSQERIRQRGAEPVNFEDRVEEFAAADIVVNTVPSTDSIPRSAYETLKGSLVVDIASPPGGLDHDAASEDGLNVVWARGLAGGRAPVSVGEGQFRFIQAAMATAAAESTSR